MMSHREIRNEATAKQWLEQLADSDESPEAIEGAIIEAILWNRAERNHSQPGPRTIQLYLAFGVLNRELRGLLA